MDTGKVHETFAQGVKNDGSSFTVRIKAFPIVKEEGELFGFIEVYPRTFDDIVKDSGFTAQKTNELLLFLELKGMVEPLPGKSYQRGTGLSVKYVVSR